MMTFLALIFLPKKWNKTLRIRAKRVYFIPPKEKDTSWENISSEESQILRCFSVIRSSIGVIRAAKGR